MTTTSPLPPAAPAPAAPALAVTADQVRAARPPLLAVAWRCGAAALAVAVGVGLLAGVAARLLMRLVAVGAEAPTGFSWLGSVMVVVAFVVLVAPAAALGLAPWAPVRWLGALASSALVAVTTTGTASTDLAHRALPGEDRMVLLVVGLYGFALLAALVGPVAAVGAHRLSRLLLRRLA